MIVALWKQANDRNDSFVDHSGALRDLKTGSVLVTPAYEDDEAEGGLGAAADDPDGDDALSTLHLFLLKLVLTNTNTFSVWVFFLR